MPKITLSKSITRTYNLGDYENYKPTVSITKEFDENEIVNIVWELNNMTAMLDAELAKDKTKLGR